MRKKVILQVADQGPLESLVVMLESVGYDCYLPTESLRQKLRAIGCKTVLSPEDLTRSMGYDMPRTLPTATERDMSSADLYVDIKAHRDGPKIWKHWPNLKDRTLWYRINGGKPEHVVNERGDHGDEINPPCPVLTPNQWYKDQWFGLPSDNPPDWCAADGKAYSCYPPFYRFKEYEWVWNARQRVNPNPSVAFKFGSYASPICLIHNAGEWGYGKLFPKLREMGLRVYGAGSPDGLLQHAHIRDYLQTAIAMIHLKSNDAPGYALYEAMASGVPIICTRRLIWRCRMQELLIPDWNCLPFDRETHDALTDDDVIECADEVSSHLHILRNPSFNLTFGENARNQLQKVMWSPNKEEDVNSLRSFLERNFPN